MLQDSGNHGINCMHGADRKLFLKQSNQRVINLLVNLPYMKQPLVGQNILLQTVAVSDIGGRFPVLI